MKAPRIMAVAWPAFLVAGLLEMLVFGLVMMVMMVVRPQGLLPARGR